MKWKQFAFVMAIFSATFGTIMSIALVKVVYPEKVKSVKAPEEFSYVPCFSANDSKLDSVFGSSRDDIGQRRNWMRLLDSGGAAQLNLPKEETARLWLLTNEFTDTHTGEEMHVYVPVETKIIVSAFRVIPESEASVTPLRRTLTQKGHVVYSLPELKPNDRILVVVYMDMKSKESLAYPKRIVLRSKQ